MDENLEMLDVSDNKEEKKKDYFMNFIMISLIDLVVLFIIVYFFGYNFLKPYIKV